MYTTKQSWNQSLLKQQLRAFAPSPEARESVRAWRYYDGTAYDRRFGREFSHPYVDWDEAHNGPRPVMQPLPRLIVDTGASFLFSRVPSFVVKNPALQPLIDVVLASNRIDERLSSEARSAGLDGGRVWKFAWCPDDHERPISIQSLPPGFVRFERDPMDYETITRASIRFKYADSDDQWWWYREDWTPRELFTYDLLPTRENDDSAIMAHMSRGVWPGRKQQANPFGLIPLTPFNNRVLAGNPTGVGDFWHLTRLIDQYNHTCWLEHHSNQLDGDPVTAILNADFDGHLAPGAVLRLRGDGADVKRLDGGNALREWIRDSRRMLRESIMRGAGYSDINPDTITNKGNMTRAVWHLVFSETISTTLEKRLHWGTNGICRFLRSVLLGLSRISGAVDRFPELGRVDPMVGSSFDVLVEWPEIFPPTSTERGEIITDALRCVEAGLIAPERAERLVGLAWEA